MTEGIISLIRKYPVLTAALDRPARQVETLEMGTPPNAYLGKQSRISCLTDDPSDLSDTTKETYRWREISS
jgi:hypothetical protein